MSGRKTGEGLANLLEHKVMYNAGPAKLGAILGKGPNVGKKNKDRFMKKYGCYHMLVRELEAELKRNGGFIYALDGRKFYVRNAKDVLNTCLQGNSAIIFKCWMILLEYKRREFVREHKVELHQIIAYHDELQYELYSEDQELANEWGRIACETAAEVGRMFNLNVPIAAEFKCGRSWNETH